MHLMSEKTARAVAAGLPQLKPMLPLGRRRVNTDLSIAAFIDKWMVALTLELNVKKAPFY